MILKLPKWILTNKFPAFHDVESLTAIEQTARVYGKINELIDNYNSFAENINKTLEEYARADQEEEEAFKNGLRQEFQDFINVVDLQIRDLEQYVKVNLNSEIRKLWNELNDNGDIQELINKTLEELITKVDNIKLSWDRYSSELELQYSTFEQNMNTKFDTLEHSVWNNFYDYKSEINTTVETFDGRITANANELVSQNASIVGLSGTISNHTERLSTLDNLSSQNANKLSLLKTGETLYNGGIGSGTGLSINIPNLALYSIIAIDIGNGRVLATPKIAEGKMYINAVCQRMSTVGKSDTQDSYNSINLIGTVNSDNSVTITESYGRYIILTESQNASVSAAQHIKSIIGLI